MENVDVGSARVPARVKRRPARALRFQWLCGTVGAAQRYRFHERFLSHHQPVFIRNGAEGGRRRHPGHHCHIGAYGTRDSHSPSGGFDDFERAVRSCPWERIEHRSGLTRNALEAAAAVYARCHAVIFVYGMGLTQHKKSVETVQTMVNLALLRGNIGRPGAGICPVRGHSNVQGQRTVGITEKPKLVPAEKIKELFGFKIPEEKGVNTVEACEKILKGEVNAFIMLGGNFVRAVPDHRQIHPAWRRIPLTVQILTKLNRSALVHGRISYILPCLGRIEIDNQATGPQAVSMEDSTGCMHGSRGQAKPGEPAR
jgi:anaerobic selenocysteine-containing dehydrogenase